jgi:general secretion pathway protein D
MNGIGSVTEYAAMAMRILLLFAVSYSLPGCSGLMHSEVSQQQSSLPFPKLDSLIGSKGTEEHKTDGSALAGEKAPAASADNNPIIYYGSSSKAAGSGGEGSNPGLARAVFSGKTLPFGVSYEAGDTVSVNFDNADIKTVAKAIFGDVLNANYTIDPNVSGVINLSTRRPLPKKQLFWLVETALKAQGAIIIRQGDLYRIAPSGDSAAAGNVSFGREERSPGYGTTVLPLENISADALNKILEGFGAPSGSVRIDTSHNMLIARGTGSEREWIIDTALAFDVDWMRRQSVGVFPIKNGSPEAIISELGQMADTTVVKFQPIARMNAVMAVANSPRTINQVATWIAKLDRENAYGPQAHVYRVKHGDAKRLASVIKEIFIGGGSGLSSTAADQVAPGNSLVSASSSPGSTLGSASPGLTAGSAASTQGTQAGGTQKAAAAPGDSRTADLDAGDAGGTAAGRLRITADTTQNAVIVYATQRDYPRIERALLELDRPPLQVAVEAIVAEVTLNDRLNYGVQYFLQNKVGGVTQVTSDSTSALSQTSSAIAQALPAFTAFLGSSSTPRVVLNALHDVTDVKVLSSPSLVAVNNQPAILQVGDQVPVQQGNATSTLTSSPAIVNTFNYIDTGVILRFTPHISRGNAIRLDIEQEVSQVVNGTNGSAGTLTPTISQRKMKSTISVGNGQTALLAGLISQQVSKEKAGIPGIIDIPVIGNLGSNTTNTAARTELIVFVKAQLIRDASDARQVAEGLRSRMPSLNGW